MTVEVESNPNDNQVKGNMIPQEIGEPTNTDFIDPDFMIAEILEETEEIDGNDLIVLQLKYDAPSK